MTDHKNQPLKGHMRQGLAQTLKLIETLDAEDEDGYRRSIVCHLRINPVEFFSPSKKGETALSHAVP